MDTPLRYLKGVGPKKEIIFKDLGINTVRDLLYYFPFRYEDKSDLKKIKDLKVGESSLVKGKVLVRSFKKIPHYYHFKKVKSIFEAVIDDGTGIITCLWFNQPYLMDYIKVGDNLLIYGKPSYINGTLKIVSPEYQHQEETSLNLGRIVGVYRVSASLTQKFMRKIIYSALDEFKGRLSDPIPFYIRQEKKLLNIAEGLKEIHFPSSLEKAESARWRFIFEELFFSQILVYLRKARHRLEKGIPIKINREVISKIEDNLTFALTDSQREVINQILDDLEKPYPMHRLLQGDVGCGKTVVSCFAIALVIYNGYQVAFMVPTEVLAYQHRDTLKNILKGFRIRIEVLTSSLSKKQARRIYEDLKEGKIDCIIGTHSLLQEEVMFKNLALVIIDEQHKFGVAQRALLPKKGRLNPHCLVMSATPIPRSLALSLYGDLDLSVIKELPSGRIQPETIWVKEEKRRWVYDFIREKLKEGRQIYIIYPVIEESDREELKSLKKMFGKICEEFNLFEVGLFHGKMKSDQKQKVIKKFRDKKIDILVSTTIVEVGINIENATVMVVENPERFGLAQLHQLRGRIQRSSHKPYFILISKDNLTDNALKRLKIISSISDGFKISEEDLKLRGPGDFFGHFQHGFPDLKIANLLRDLEALREARAFAYRVIKSDPYLKNPTHRCIRNYLDLLFKEKKYENIKR
jgi:ATP-dependent DNA helicase RecG